MSALTRFLRNRNRKQKESGEEQSRLYRIVSNVAVIGVFLAVGLLVLGVFKIFKMNTFMFGLVSTIAIISIACLLVLPWIRIFEKGKYKKVAVVFMVFVVVCAVLWLVCIFMGIKLYKDARADVAKKENLVEILNFIKATLIISLQFLMLSLIASTIIKFQKKMLIFQTITYISNLFFDAYVTCFLLCISISSKEGLEISKNIEFLGNKFMIVMFILSIIYMMISAKIMQNVEAKRFKHAVEDNYEIDGAKKLEKEVKTESTQTVEEKLESLKNLLDKNLISQEEYDKKREEILKDM